MPLSFVHQNEHPSWSTQFGRQILQMLAQGVIGGGTNLLQGAIMQGIKNRDANEMMDKNIGAQREVAAAGNQSRFNAANLRRENDLDIAEQSRQADSQRLQSTQDESLYRSLGERTMQIDPGEAQRIQQMGPKWAPRNWARTTKLDSETGQKLPVEGDPTAQKPIYQAGEEDYYAPTREKASNRWQDWFNTQPEDVRQKAAMPKTTSAAEAEVERRKTAMLKHELGLEKLYTQQTFEDKQTQKKFINALNLYRVKLEAGDTQAAARIFYSEPLLKQAFEARGITIPTIIEQMGAARSGMQWPRPATDEDIKLELDPNKLGP
jgi:hypothetical protein